MFDEALRTRGLGPALDVPDGKPFAYLDRPLCTYVRREGSLTTVTRRRSCTIRTSAHAPQTVGRRGRPRSRMDLCRNMCLAGASLSSRSYQRGSLACVRAWPRPERRPAVPPPLAPSASTAAARGPAGLVAARSSRASSAAAHWAAGRRRPFARRFVPPPGDARTCARADRSAADGARNTPYSAKIASIQCALK
jgi:hypothetical protein